MIPTGRKLRALSLGVFLIASSAYADVVVLKNNHMYSGVIEEYTSQSVQLFDGNLRRVLSVGNIRRVVQERPDTSWILVGDRMLRQEDWKTAAYAYNRALEYAKQSDDDAQPEVALERLANLRAYRYHVPGGDEARSLLKSKRYAEAAEALSAVVQKAEGMAKTHYWVDQLARAYAELASEALSDDPAKVNAHLIYALGIAPDCGPARAVYAQHLEKAGFHEEAQAELLVALTLDSIDPIARGLVEPFGVDWTYGADPQVNDQLLNWARRNPTLLPAAEAPLTTPDLAAKIEGPLVAQLKQPARLLLAAYIMDPTTAIVNQGNLPYREITPVIEKVFSTTKHTTGETPYDKPILKSSVKVKIDPRFIRSIAIARSEYVPDYQSPRGERGLLPLSRRQWEIAARYADVDWDFDKSAGDVDKSAEMACQYLEWLRRVALAPYVRGKLEHLERID